MAEEWDVFQMLPGTDAPVYLATLYSAYYKTFRPELNGPGAGSFAINRSSPECTEAILAQGNLVKIRTPEIHTDYINAFFLETGDFTLISSQEAGGEMLTFGGRGILSYLEYARAWSESYIDGGQDPIAGVWRAYNAGTGSAPGQILRRLIEEFQDPDRPQFPIPHLTVDFDYDDDSTGDPWDETDATAEFAYQVGEDGLAIVQRLIDTQTITVQMDPDFTLHAYNVLNYGRDLTGDAFGADVVRFVRGTNIAIELRRELAVLEVQTHMLASGEDDRYGTAALSDAADRVTKEGYIAAFGTGTTALDGIADAELLTRLGKSDTITFPINNRRTQDVELGNPVSVGAVATTPGLATAGFYLPGPEGTLGDFWVGDTVRVHTGTDPFDYTEANAVVEAITITREDENKELAIIPELKTRITPIVCVPPQVSVFQGTQPFSGFLFEVSGVSGTPVDSGSRTEQDPAVTAEDTVDLVGAGFIMAGFIWSAELTDSGTYPAATSADLTQDYNYAEDASPQYFIGHAQVGSGTHSGNVTYSPRPNDYTGWASSAAVFPGTGTIVQTTSGTSTGDILTIGFASPPQPGSLLVIFLADRQTPGGQFPITAGWTGLAEAPTPLTPPVHGPRFLRMLWYPGCAP